MKALAVLATLLIFLSSPASANPWEVQGGHDGWGNENWTDGEEHGPYYDSQGYEGHPTLFGGYEEEIWDGNCKIEREWEGDGDYREERECH
jgi:hypothetical protein